MAPASYTTTSSYIINLLICMVSTQKTFQTEQDTSTRLVLRMMRQTRAHA